MAMTLKELSLVAELDYERLRDGFKAKALEFFNKLDLDGNGALTLTELMNSNLEGNFGEEFIQHVFYSLDEDGKGFLSFRESLTLYYLCMYSTRLCNGCQRNIPHGLGYTCFKCWKKGASSTDGLQTFSLCLECYSTQNYQHDHDPRNLLHDFVLFDNLLHNKPSSPTAPMPAPIRAIEQTVKQCIVCGDHHESTAPGFTCDVHMARMRDSTEFVCEWCFSYMCSKCGNLFRDSTTRAEPGKWLQRFVCPSCHDKKIVTDCYDTSLKRLQREFAIGSVELLKYCRTCEIKQRNGTLFWIVNGTNNAPSTPSAPPASILQQQQRPSAPALNAKQRNYSAFDANQPPASAARYDRDDVKGVGALCGCGQGSGNVSSFARSHGNYRNSKQNEDSDGSSHGGSCQPGCGGRGNNQTNLQDEGANLPFRGGGGRGRGGSGGYANRNTIMQDDVGSISSPSSGSSNGDSNIGRPPFNRASNFQKQVAAAARNVNRMVHVARAAATIFDGIGFADLDLGSLVSSITGSEE